MHAFVAVSLHQQFAQAIADAKNAFCQSKRLEREGGPIYVEPCEGLPLAPGSLIELVAPVYGLDDAPLAWHRTIVDWFMNHGFKKHLLEPCWYMRFDSRGKLDAQVLIEVDDLFLAAPPRVLEKIRSDLFADFEFGKWKSLAEGESEFAGRRFRLKSDRMLIDQEKYILEQIAPLPLPRKRKASKEDLLDPSEFAHYRHMVYKINWVASQSRPEVAGTASILAGSFPTPTVEDYAIMQKACKMLRATASQSLTIWAMDLDWAVFVTFSDCGGVGSASKGGAQGAWITGVADLGVRDGSKGRFSPLSWKSSKIKRAVPSTLSGETITLSNSLGEAEWMSLLLRDARFGDVKVRGWRKCSGPFCTVLPSECEIAKQLGDLHVVDAKSIYDTLTKRTAGSQKDRRTSIELAVIRDTFEHTGGIVRWVPHPRMPADIMNKADVSKGNDALNHLLRTGMIRLTDESVEMHQRQQGRTEKGRSKAASRRDLASQESYPSNNNNNHGYV